MVTSARWRHLLLSVLGCIWLLHAVGIVMPETGFDAVWYHLPIIKAMADHGSLVYLPNLYQSVNPLWGELWFLLGWRVGGEVGAKFFAYLMAVGTVTMTGIIARRWLSQNWTLLAMILVSLIQVMTWQASSIYVDVIKAFWELTAVWAVITAYDLRSDSAKSWQYVVVASLALSASLATKLFSLVLWPLWLLWVVWVMPGKWRRWLLSGLFVFVLPVPFYWWAWWNTGQPFLALTLHTQKVAEIGGVATLSGYVSNQLLRIWLSPWQLLISRDYVSWLIVLLLPAVVLKCREWWADVPSRILISLWLWQWLVWWCVPPLSTRYALSGFIVLTVLAVRFLATLWHRREWQLALMLTLSLAVVSQVAPRAWVLKRQLPYLFGQQTKQQYLQQFLDGNIDMPLKAWHHL